MRALLTRLMIGASNVFLFVSPLLAATPSSAPAAPTLDAWVHQVNHRIDEAISSPGEAYGMVTVTFRRGEDGRATDIAVHTADPLLAAAARTTIRRVGRLPALPAGIDPRELVQMQLLFDGGTDIASYRAKRSAMLAAASQANQDLAMRSGNAQVAISH